MSKRLLVILSLATCLLAGPGLLNAMAHRHRLQKRNQAAGHRLPAPVNQLYNDRCGACHLAYPPGLLPAGSWSKILQGQAQHYGEDLGLQPAEQKDLGSYLGANAADACSAKLARKIMRCLGPRTPLRITEVPYIIRKHQDDDVPRGAFQRKSVGSMANCGACHPGAAAGDFDEHAVRIPPE